MATQDLAISSCTNTRNLTKTVAAISKDEAQRLAAIDSMSLQKVQQSHNVLIHLAEATFRSPAQMIAELVGLLLAEPIGTVLQENLLRHRRTLGQEVERNLILFREQIPTDEIIDLAQTTLRTPDEMLIRLVLIGLEEYKKRGMAESN